MTSRIDLEFKENLLYQEGILSETYQRPDKSYFYESGELENLVNMGRLVQILKKQADRDKILKIIQQKLLKGMHLPVTVKEIQAGYLVSSYFKDIYLYLAQNMLPNNKTAIKKVKALAEMYIILDSLLFKIVLISSKVALLALPEVFADKIITFYHSSLFTGHQGVIKTYLAISHIFFILNLIHYLHLYIKDCHIYQPPHNEKLPARWLQTRINLNYRQLTKLSMDLKVMPRSHKGHIYIYIMYNRWGN